MTARTLRLALHIAAVIVVAIVGIKPMSKALDVCPTRLVLLAFVAGGGFTIPETPSVRTPAPPEEMTITVLSKP